MRLIASSLMAGVLALGAVAPAFADNDRRGHSNRDYDRDRHRDRDWNDRDYRNGYKDARRDDRRHDRWDDRRWNRGDRFDRRDTRYVVVRDHRSYRDYRGYNLRTPRHGEYYVRDDRTGEILLIAAATGLILWALND